MRSALLICLFATAYSLHQFQTGQFWHGQSPCQDFKDFASCLSLAGLLPPQSLRSSQQHGRISYHYHAEQTPGAASGGGKGKPPLQDPFADFWSSWKDLHEQSEKTSLLRKAQIAGFRSWNDIQEPNEKTSLSGKATQTGPTPASTPTKARPNPVQGKPSGICPSNGGMNDQIRQKFLDVHNELRSLVANGKAEDGYGGYAPKAAAMSKLKYDCNVENHAVKHAAKCVFQHSNTKGLGENIYMRSPAYDPVKAAEDASRSWFSELAKNGVGKDLTFSMRLFNKNVGHYTQMVWQSTKVIGCAVQNCPRMSFVVCNYKEAGNMLNAKIYETGTPCSKCSGGCSEGLCIV